MLRSKLAYALATAALLAVAPPSTLPFAPMLGTQPAQAQQVNVSFSIFFDNLASEGRWVRHSHYRYIWCPDVDDTWAPYTNGHWIYLTGRGWYFASDEPFAWAVYHYGRWFRDADLGWCWVPGNIWAPAWVSWRRSQDYIGWAPLYPEGDGFAISFSISSREPPRDDWFFIPTRSFLEPQLSVGIVFGARQPDIFTRTQFVGPVTVQNNIVVNNVINVNFIEQQTNQKVVEVKPQTVSDPKAVTSAPQGQTIPVFNANIAQPKKDEAPAQAVDVTQAVKEKGKPAGATGTTGAQTGTTTTTTTTTGGKPAATCLPAEMVNGVCPPAGGKNKNKPATTGTTPNAVTTETTTPTTTNNPSKGKGAAKCLPDEMINGVCPPAGGKNRSTNKPASTETTTNAVTPETTTTTTNNPPKGKAKCPPDEMVNGVCPPAGGKNKSSNTDNTAAPAVTDNTVAPSKNGSQKGTTTENTQQGAPATTEAPPKGKRAKCLPEEMVNGVCPVKGKGGSQDNTSAQ